ELTWRISSWFGRNRAHKETGYMAAIPERYFQEKTLGLLGASIYGAARAYMDVLTASLRSACFHRCGHFVNNLKPLKLIFARGNFTVILLIITG
ncbi:hypothetical protein, partial [Yersinia enterocolitica]|uniref:hypothetical protein n=1 Tax=Yersinia enterocolitica TaxID=630 RepID=UPI0012AF6397